MSYRTIETPAQTFDYPIYHMRFPNGNSQILAQHDGSFNAKRYFYLHDRLGSVRQVIDTMGNVVNHYTYRPFGELYPAPDFEQTVNNPFKFTGQFYDFEINEYYLRARMYDPHIGRFTARDPVAGKFTEPLTLHTYLYCLNDPVNKVDPKGEFVAYASQLVRATISGAVRGALAGAARGAYKWATQPEYAWRDFVKDLGSGALGGAFGAFVGNSGMVAKLLGDRKVLQHVLGNFATSEFQVLRKHLASDEPIDWEELFSESLTMGLLGQINYPGASTEWGGLMKETLSESIFWGLLVDIMRLPVELGIRYEMEDRAKSTP